MLPDLTLPVSLMALLARFRPVFTAPSFRTFCALAAGFLAQTGRRTVCGMLTGAGLAGAWPHQRAHRFFSAARWSSERLGLVLAKLIVAALVPEGGPVLVAIDDTLFRRAGKKVHAIGWFHDGSVKGPHQVGLGNNWVIAAIVVWLPFMTRPVALPVLARLVHKDLTPAPASRLVLARQMTAALAAALPGRDIHVAADAAYAGKEPARLPANVTWTTRLRKDAALYELPGPRTGKRGRPRVKGPRLPDLATLAATACFAPVTVHRYGKTATIQAAALTCLWHGVFGARPAQVVLVRDRASTGFDIALATTDLTASPAQVIERYASRWSIEMVFSQLAKGPVRPVWRGGQHVADFDVAAGDDDAVDEQLGQLPPLGEGGGGQPAPDGVAEALDSVGDGGEFQPLSGGGFQLPLLGGQGVVPAVQFLALALEFIEPDHLGQVGVEQALGLAVELAQGLADGRLPGLEFLGQPGPAAGPGQRAGDLGGVGQQRAQVCPDQLVELAGGDVAGGAALPLRRAQRVSAAAAQVVAVAGRALPAGA